jgi:hypothetical protein
MSKKQSRGIPLGAGIISGLSSAIAIKTGVSLGQEFYLRMVLSTVCEVTNKNFPKGSSWSKPDCGLYLTFFDFVTLIIVIGTFIYVLFAMGNIISAIILYVVGFIIGFMLIFLILH